MRNSIAFVQPQLEVDSKMQQKFKIVDFWERTSGITLLLAVISSLTTSVRSECSFPNVLWSRGQGFASRHDVIDGDKTGNGSQRSWVTEEKHVSNAPSYESRKFIVAKADEILIVHQYTSMCEGKTCIRTDAEQTLFCTTAEGGDKYRVRRRANGYDDIICLKFVVRSRNVVQLWSSRPSDTHMENLCSDTELRRNEWPWIAQNDIEWSPCPFSGGYDFYAYLMSKKMVCERIRTPSLLDVDCVAGEGLHFTFPATFCTIFHSPDVDNTLQCFGSWSEDNYTFIVAASSGRSAQYVLRIPEAMLVRPATGRLQQQQSQFDVYMYYSPICPLTDSGQPSARQVMYMILKLQRARPTPITAEFQSEGCEFPSKYRGNWLLMENRRPESVTVSENVIHSPFVFGNVLCSKKHQSKSHYKLASAFTNGCRPRYTCVEFDYDDKINILRFRLSPSLRGDKSFDDMCTFQSDPAPLGSLYRSQEYKVLYPVPRTRQLSCGLDGLVRVSVTSQNLASSSSLSSSMGLSDVSERSCDGSLSDWNPFTCSLTSSVMLIYRNCTTNNALVHREYICEAYIDIKPGYRILFIKEANNGDAIYSCWLVAMTSNSSSNTDPLNQRQQLRPPWLTVTTIPRSICNQNRNPADSSWLQHSAAAFYVLPDARERQCIFMHKVPRKGPDVIQYTRTSMYGSNASVPVWRQRLPVAMSTVDSASAMASLSVSSSSVTPLNAGTYFSRLMLVVCLYSVQRFLYLCCIL